ncbi:unnamed protein product, partial [Ceratitis capitata]
MKATYNRKSNRKAEQQQTQNTNEPKSNQISLAQAALKGQQPLTERKPAKCTVMKAKDNNTNTSNESK